MKRFAQTGVVLAAMLLVVGTVFSYNANTTQGHFLYPLKQAAESVKMGITKSPSARVELHLDYAKRRLDEVKTLLKGSNGSVFATAQAQDDSAVTSEEQVDTDAAADTLDEVVTETEGAVDEVSENISDPEEAADALEQIQETQEGQLDELGELVEGAPAEVVDDIADAIDDTATDLGEVVAAAEEVAEAVENGDESVDVNIETSGETADETTNDSDNGEDAAETPSDKQLKAEAELVAALARFETFKTAVESAELDSSKSERFVGKVESKLEAAQKALEEGNYGKAYGMLKAAQAHANVEKSFANRKDSKKSDDSGEDESAEDDDENDDAEDVTPPPADEETPPTEEAPSDDGTSSEEDDSGDTSSGSGEASDDTSVEQPESATGSNKDLPDNAGIGQGNKDTKVGGGKGKK